MFRGFALKGAVKKESPPFRFAEQFNAAEVEGLGDPRDRVRSRLFARLAARLCGASTTGPSALDLFRYLMFLKKMLFGRY